MKTLVALLIVSTTTLSSMKIDFGTKNKQTNWYVINDGVMGGLSQSEVNYTPESLLFKGTVSLENNGGFSSIRSEFDSYDLSKFKAVEIRYKASDYNFAFNLATSRDWYRPVYRVDIANTKGQWATKVFKLSEFKEVIVGKQTGNKLAAQKRKDIIRLGFITNEKRAGDFLLEVDYIRFIE